MCNLTTDCTRPGYMRIIVVLFNIYIIMTKLLCLVQSVQSSTHSDSKEVINWSMSIPK